MQKKRVRPVKKFLSTFGAAGAILLLCSSAGAAASEFNAAQKSEIEKIAAAYIAEHPEVMVAALQKLEQQQKDLQTSNVRNLGAFYRASDSTPHRGSKDAAHYIVEFFDFSCGYCKLMEPLMEQLMDDPKYDAQVIYVNLPVISPDSIKSATVGQAIFNLSPEGYFRYHKKLMTEKVALNNLDELREIAEDLDLDWEKVLEEIRSRRPQDKISEDLVSSKTLGITGTPYLIIDGHEFRGAIKDYGALTGLLEQPEATPPQAGAPKDAGRP